MVTSGVISNIGQPKIADATIGTLAEMYQITIPAGSANSGSPVFDAIGLSTYVSGADELITYVVPIRYATEPMSIQ